MWPKAASIHSSGNIEIICTLDTGGPMTCGVCSHDKASLGSMRWASKWLRQCETEQNQDDEWPVGR
ncbi:hypothetical protein Zm00014a_030880 [Zea mays]|uniref:Uncharacterized protein n=1 Tax=Zea mays TaxID=4577 RepID=A0A3L6EV40_MAIZE|nr:hypothetical protein Zm00014a_030880 [Zea mays]